MRATSQRDDEKSRRVVQSSNRITTTAVPVGAWLQVATVAVWMLSSSLLSSVAVAAYTSTSSFTAFTAFTCRTRKPPSTVSMLRRRRIVCSNRGQWGSSSSSSNHGIAVSLRMSSSSSSSSTSSSSSFPHPDDQVPDEATLQKAYDSWREYYGKRGGSSAAAAAAVSLAFDPVRYQHFKDNYVALKRANTKAAAKARAEGREPPPPMQLNEYGDCSAEEYKRLTGTTSTSTTGTTTAVSPTSSYLAAAGAAASPPIPNQGTSATPLPNSSTGTNNSGSSSSSYKYYDSNLTPPPTSAPWAGGTSSTSSTFTYDPSTTTSSSKIRSTNSYRPDTPDDPPMNDSTTISGKTFTKMEPSSAYQAGGDGTYSFVPGGKSEGTASDLGPTTSYSSSSSSSSLSNEQRKDATKRGGGGNGNPSRTTGLESYVPAKYQTDTRNQGWDTVGAGGATPTTNSGQGGSGGGTSFNTASTSNTGGGGYSYSSSSSSPPPPGVTGSVSSSSTLGGAGGDSTTSSSSYYMPPPPPGFAGTATGGYVGGSASYMPPTSTTTSYGKSATFTANGQSDYLSNLSNGNYPANDNNSNNDGNYNAMGGSNNNNNNYYDNGMTSNNGMATNYNNGNYGAYGTGSNNNGQFSHNPNPAYPNNSNNYIQTNNNGYFPPPHLNYDPRAANAAAESAPQLSSDEQAALDRARSRHQGIPKQVFDDDESEDENTDNAWAEYGMKPKPKHRREKVDYGEPILNGVGNGGGIAVGPNSGTYNNNYNPSSSTTTTNPSTYSAMQQVTGGGGSYAPPAPQNGSYSSSYAPPPAVAVAGGTSSTSASYSVAMPGGGGYPTNSFGGIGNNNNNNNNNNPIQDRVREAYQDWCNHHGKTYEERRLPIFRDNFFRMESYCQESGTPLKQLNKYADLSQDEYKLARPPSKSKSNTPDWILETPESKIESKEEFLTFGPRWGKEPPPGAEALLNKESIDPVTGAKRDFQGEKRLRLAYQEWCNRNGKRFEESRLPAFTNNFVAMQNYCMTQNIAIKPLNEHADLTPNEYHVMLQEKQAQGETIPSFGSPEAGMPPNFIGYNVAPPPQQQQQQQDQYGGGTMMPQQQQQQQQQLGGGYSYTGTGNQQERPWPLANGLQPESGQPQGGSFNGQQQLGLPQGGYYNGQQQLGLPQGANGLQPELGQPQGGYYNGQQQLVPPQSANGLQPELGQPQGGYYNGQQQLVPPQGGSYNGHQQQQLGPPQGGYYNGQHNPFPPQGGSYNSQQQLGGGSFNGQQMGPPQGGMAPPQYYNGGDPSQKYQGNSQQFPPPQQYQGQPQQQNHNPGEYGFTQAQAPRMATGGQLSGLPLGGTGGTIPPVSLGADGRRSDAILTQPPSTTARNEDQFKTAAEARLKAFSQAKRKKKEEGEARLKRFTDLKKEAKLISLQRNITMEEATRIVFSNATASFEQEKLSLTDEVGGNVSSASSDEDLTSNDDQILEELAVVQCLIHNEKDNAKNASTAFVEVKGDSTKNLTGNANEPLLPSSESTQSGTDTISPSEKPPVSKHRPVVDLSAVLQIEKTAIKKEPNVTSASGNTTSTDKEQKSDKHRSDVSYRGTPAKTIDVMTAVKTPEKKEVEKTKASSPATPDGAFTKNVDISAKSGHEVSGEVKVVPESPTKTVGSVTVYDAEEEARLKSQMEALQAKLQSFEVARKKAEGEAIEKATEARQLKLELNTRQLDVEDTKRKTKVDEQLRTKVENPATGQIEQRGRESDTKVKTDAKAHVGHDTTRLKEDIKLKQKEAVEAKKKAEEAKTELEKRKREIEERRKKFEKPIEGEAGKAALAGDKKYSPLGKYASAPLNDDGKSKVNHTDAERSNGDVERKKREADRARTRAENERRAKAAKAETVPVVLKQTVNTDTIDTDAKEKDEVAKCLKEELKAKEVENQSGKSYASKIASNTTASITKKDDNNGGDKVKDLLRKLL